MANLEFVGCGVMNIYVVRRLLDLADAGRPVGADGQAGF
jgi:hypothetical protein